MRAVFKHAFWIVIFLDGIVLSAQLPTLVISEDIASDRVFSSDTVYQLDGFIYVRNSATLTIEAGTLIQGHIDGSGQNTMGSLIISRDGFIDAQGTECSPIVFTSAKPIGQRGEGDWGGLVILGEATINSGTDQGGYFTDVLEGGFSGNVAYRTYGGNDDQDSSGVLSYIRLEFSGAELAAFEETNALTLAGVGNKTQIDHIMVTYAGDDALEMLGGTVNATHLIAHRTRDDNFDCAQGYRGQVQWGIIYQDANTADISRSEGWETDNDNSDPSATPRTAPVFSNVTLIGPKATGTPSSRHQSAARIRRGSYTSIHNSLFVDHVNGLFIDGDDSYVAWNSGMEFKGNVMAGMTNNFKASGTHTTTDMDVLWSANNTNYTNTSSVGFQANYDQLDAPNLVPDGTSILLSGADWSFSGAADFDQVNYRGALDPSDDWTLGWTEWDAQTADYGGGIGNGTGTIDGLTAATPGNYTVSFSWNSTGASTYWVYFRETTAGSYTKLVTNTNGLTIQNRTPGQYEWYVTEAGDVNASCNQEFSIVCDDFNYNVNVFQIVDATGGKANVFGINGGRRLWDIALISDGDTTWAINRWSRFFRNLSPGDYTVLVRDAYGCYSSQTENFTIDPVDSSAIPVLSSIQRPNGASGGVLRPVWSIGSTANIDRYQVRVKDMTGGGLGTLYGAYIAVGASTTQYDVSGLPPARYRIDVRARINGSFANGVYSNFKERIITASKTQLDASDGEAARAVTKAYPNPTKGQIFVAAPEGSEVYLLDLNGRILRRAKVAEGEANLDISSLAKSVYLIRIHTDHNIYTERILKD